MKRREFLRASCVGGLASLGAAGLLASDQSERSKLPGESDAQYRARGFLAPDGTPALPVGWDGQRLAREVEDATA